MLLLWQYPHFSLSFSRFVRDDLVCLKPSKSPEVLLDRFAEKETTLKRQLNNIKEGKEEILDSEKKEETASLTKLMQLAKQKGYNGPDTLMTLEQYHSLF